MIARLRRGDLDALGELYRELGPAMVSLARSLLRDRAEADDVVADCLIKVHDKAAGFRGERGLRTWVLRIVANRCRLGSNRPNRLVICQPSAGFRSGSP